MKVLLVNYRYFISGGPERYLFNITDAMEKKGHQIIPFSIRYHKNQPTPYSEFFADPIGSEDEIYFREHKRDLRTTYKTLQRLFFDRSVQIKIEHLISETKPDIAYVLHYQRKLSPALLVGIKNMGLPIVVRLSDYAMLCPQAHFFRGSSTCELCLEKNLLYSIKYRCVHQSYIASIINYLSAIYHKYKKYHELIDMFVTTNDFMQKKIVEAGYQRSRLMVIPTFVNIDNFKKTGKKKSGLIVFVGRLEKIKGIHILIEALKIIKQNNKFLDFHLKIFGEGEEQYTKQLIRLATEFDVADEIEFCGNNEFEVVSKYLSSAIVSVVPSIIFENLPQVILESYACGTAVVASNLGSLPMAIKEGVTGYLFKPGNSEDLANKLSYCLSNPEKMKLVGINAYNYVRRNFSEDDHVISLEKLFNFLINKNQYKRNLGNDKKNTGDFVS